MSLSKPSGSNKRKITDEHRQFQENWELQYFCSEINNKILCLICKSVISVPKLYNIKRHYEQHKSKYDQYEGLLREEKLKEFISGYKKQQIMFTKIPQENEAAVKVSYVLSELIAKHSKPFTEGDFIKTCLIKTAEIICPGNLKAFQNISLTRNTVAERITELACNLNNQIKIKIPTFEYFSIACDESTDIGGTAQLAVFFRACDMEFNIFEELLEIIPMFDTTTGENVFVSVFELLKKYDLPLKKLSSVATDGAPSMTGKNKGFVERLQKKANEYVEHKFHRTHCIIHQEVLCTKVINMAHVIRPVKQMVNFIRSRGMNQRQFSIFLNDLESEYSGLPYFTEVRWLSCSTVLERFWKLRDTIQIFLESKEQDVSVLSDPMWLQDLSFMVDITKHLSNLNLKLQGKNQIITAINDHVKAFKCKLDLFKTQLQNEDLTHFPAYMTYTKINNDPISYKKYSEKIMCLKTEFENRFQDFQYLENDFALFTSPFSIDAVNVSTHIQMELIEIQNDSNLKNKFNDVGVPDFYSFVPTRYVKKFVDLQVNIYRSKKIISSRSLRLLKSVLPPSDSEDSETEEETDLSLNKKSNALTMTVLDESDISIHSSSPPSSASELENYLKDIDDFPMFDELGTDINNYINLSTTNYNDTLAEPKPEYSFDFLLPSFT
ncbi:hypothetical protein QTP88_000724 [Uroleucon formosanum]